MQLRDYQQQAIDDLRAAYAAGHRRALYRLATGGGKTVTFGAALSMRRVPQALVLCHRRELVTQAIATLGQLGVRAGAICGSVADPAPGADVQVATVQTLRSRGLPDGFDPGLVVVDEAHLSASPTWTWALDDLLAGSWVMGVTGTPERLDGRPLGDLYTVLVEGPPETELLERGSLVPDVTYSTPAAPPVPERMTDAAAAKALGTPALVGEVVQTYRRLGAGRTALIFASSIDHAERIEAAARQAGIAAATVTGQTPQGERDDLLARLAGGDLTMLCNYGVLVEGFDCPRVSYIGLARATASLTVYLQAVGRGLRPCPEVGKTDCIVADHGGNAELRFGPAIMAREWSLEGSKRSRAVATVDAALAIATCSQCLAVYQRAKHPLCPRCGAQPHPAKRRFPRHVAGELERLDREAWEQRQRERSQETGPRPAPSWCPPGLWAGLERTRQRRGYKLGWTVVQARRQTRQRRGRR